MFNQGGAGATRAGPTLRSWAGARATTLPGRGRRVSGRGVTPWVLLPLLGTILALIRVQFGFDYGDGAHAVELAQRVAAGDRPLVDEMNLQVLGAWPAVPFTWAWTRLFGDAGIVLASRAWFVLLSLAVATVAWRALAPHVGRAVSGVAVAVAVIPAAYNLPVVSYNTTPALLLLLATSATVAARLQDCARWGAVAGASVAAAAISHPVTTPAAAVLGVLALLVTRSGRVRWCVAAGATAVWTVTLAYLFMWWGGLDALGATLTFTQDYQAERLSGVARLGLSLDYYEGQLLRPVVAAAAAAAALAALPRREATRARWARPLLLTTSLGLLVVGAVTGGSPQKPLQTWAWTSGVAGMIVVAVLLIPAVAMGLQRRQPEPVDPAGFEGSGVEGSGVDGSGVDGIGDVRVPHVRLLLAVGLPPTLVGAPVVSAMTSSFPVWGAVAAVMSPALLAVTASVGAGVRREGRLALAAFGAALLAVLTVAHAGTSFRSPPDEQLTTRVSSGAFAGLISRQDLVSDLRDREAVAQPCAKGRPTLTYEYPSAFLIGDGSFGSPIIWLDDFGAANHRVLRWIERAGPPACVLMPTDIWDREGSHARDPLLGWIRSHYREQGRAKGLIALVPSG